MITKKLLKNRNFYLLMGYQLFVGLADKLFLFCIPWLVYDLTKSATQMVLTFGVTMAPYLIFCFFGGTLVDYFNRRKMLLITTSLSALTLIAFSIALSHVPEKIGLEFIYVLCFLIATYNALDIPAFDASTIDYFEKEELISVNSTIEIILNICNTTGPLLAGAMIALLGAKDAILAIAFLFVGAFTLMKLSQPAKQSSACKKYESTGEFIYEHGHFIKEGFEYLFREENPILFGVTMAFLGNLVFGSKDVLITYVARDFLDMSAESLASVITIGSVCSLIIVTLIAYRLRKLHTFTLMAATLFIDSIACAIIGISDQRIFILGFYCLTIVTESLYNIFARTFRQTYVDPNYMGRVTGMSRSLTYSATALGAIISGTLLEFISVKAFFTLGGLLLALIACVSYYLIKRRNPAIFKLNA